VGILAGSTIIANRQHDVDAELKKIIAKQVGNLILVTWAGHDMIGG